MGPLQLLSCCCYSHQLAIVSKFCFRLLLLRPHTLTHQQEDESGVEEKEKWLAFFLSFLAGTFGLQNCSVEDSFFFFFFFLGIRKMDYGGASKQEEGEHACYTLILLQVVKNLVSLCEILGCSAILKAASFFYMERFWL